MKALRYLGPNELEIQEIMRPEPGVGEVLLRVGACGICGLVMARYEAKKAKNFAEADRIRDELKAQGVEIIDAKDGATWKRV